MRPRIVRLEVATEQDIDIANAVCAEMKTAIEAPAAH